MYSQAYRDAHPEEVRARKRAWRLANKELIDKRAKEWKEKNPQKAADIQKKWREENRDKVKDLKLRKNYGISLSDYNLIFEEQNRVCAICKNPPTEKYFDVDHDHVTGLVRGLLCKPCNKAIAFLQDKEENALAAAQYLKESKERNKWPL